jgi:hypothetical protein
LYAPLYRRLSAQAMVLGIPTSSIRLLKKLILIYRLRCGTATQAGTLSSRIEQTFAKKLHVR